MRTYDAMPGERIDKACEAMVELANRTGEPVTMEFNEIPLDAAPGSDPKAIAASYSAEMQRRSDEYHASPEYAQRQKEAAEAQAVKEREQAAALATAPEKPTLTSNEAWDNWYAQQGDPYGQAIFHFAAKWARIMEARMAAGAKLEDCADEACSLADDDGITGFMYGAAVSTLAKLWVHGEELRRWHNLKTQVRGEGERANESGGVLNPALLTIG
jgi:hypothetical protein